MGHRPFVFLGFKEVEMARKVYIRLKSAGNILTVSRYEKGLWMEYENKKGGRKKGDPEGPRGNRETRRRILDLATTNFSAGDKFVTLTFADGWCDVTDVQACNRLFHKFSKRMRKVFPDFKYIAVLEFQDTNGRGAVHYHMLCNVHYMNKHRWEQIWKYGFVKVNRINHVDNVGAYIVKYMVKDIGDPRLSGQKAYLCSKGLDRPTILHDGAAEATMGIYGLNRAILPVYEGTYDMPEETGGGRVLWQQYNLNRPEGGRHNDSYRDAYKEHRETKGKAGN